MSFEMLIAFIQQSLRLSSTLLLGSTGEIITEKSGNLNLGTPGIMAGGAISGIVGAYFYTGAVETVNPLLGVLITLLCGLIGIDVIVEEQNIFNLAIKLLGHHSVDFRVGLSGGKIVTAPHIGKDVVDAKPLQTGIKGNVGACG